MCSHHSVPGILLAANGEWNWGGWGRGQDGRQETWEEATTTDQVRDDGGSAQGEEEEIEVWRSGQ